MGKQILLNNRRLAIGFLMLLLGAGWCHASQYETKPLARMVQDAAVIAQGTVTRAGAERDGLGRIWTRYTVAVSDWLKTAPGAAPTSATRELTVRQLGGRLDGITCTAHGVPHFSPGETVLLFTRDYGAGFQSVVNGPQGALRLGPAPAPADAPTSGVARLAAAPPAPAAPDLPVFYDRPPTDLEAFKAEIRRLARQPEPAPPQPAPAPAKTQPGVNP